MKRLRWWQWVLGIGVLYLVTRDSNDQVGGLEATPTLPGDPGAKSGVQNTWP